MILSLILAIHIYFIPNFNDAKHCGVGTNVQYQSYEEYKINPIAKGIIEGCANLEKKEIYITDGETIRPRDFSLYHELVGHELIGDDFPTTLFADREVMADQAAVYIYNIKYHWSIPQTPDRLKFFQDKCNQECVDTILKIEVPKVELKSFIVRN